VPEVPAGDGLRIVPFGDAAVLVILSDAVGPGPEPAARAMTIARALDERRPGSPAIGRSVPAHKTVLVPFDPLAIDIGDVIALVRDTARAGPGMTDDDGGPPEAKPAEPAERAAIVEIPVRYGDGDGPDLVELAATRGLRPADVIELHAGARYRVLFLGFAPGFAYLGGLPAELVSPRRTSPRERVPAGSVAIAGEHTGVYPLAMPGGWNLIGRTDARLFDPARPDPALLHPGGVVRFVPVR
jgi:KipI family sensor histidine kinase inhibitor